MVSGSQSATETTAITDRGLPHLYALRDLQELKLIGTEVTGAGLEGLMQHLPFLHITVRRVG